MLREGRCVHFTGLQHRTCKADVEYASVEVKADPSTGVLYSLPCLTDHNPGCASCAKQHLPTEQELAEDKAAIKRRYELLGQGIAPCCNVPIDTSQVINSGKYVGHGPRYCSKCRKLLFTV